MMRRRLFLRNASLAFLASTWANESVFSQKIKKNRDNKKPENKPLLLAKLREAIYAHVIADAMGGSVENLLPEEVIEKFGNWDFNNFIPPIKNPESKLGKGDGRTTDDALNLEALIGSYLRHQDHLDAYDYAENFIKEITENKVWIAEKGKEITPHDRPLWWPERYVYNRLVINNIEPRYAGIGNYINEGFQGVMLPVGAVNAGDFWRAYHEASQIGLAHTESFGIEAAAINAACYATAFQKDSSIKSVIETALLVAKDGSKMALEDVLKATNNNDNFLDFAKKTRKAVLPYLQLSPAQLRAEIDTPKSLRKNTNIARPSRIAVVENFPIALACLVYGNGDYFKTLKAGIFYGRDGETIAAVATSLLCAIKGENIIPEKLKREVDAINRRNYNQTAQKFFEVIKGIYEKDKIRLENRKNVLF